RDTAQPQHQLEIGRAERAFAGLADDRLAAKRREFGDDLPAGLAAHQYPATRSRIADPGADAARAPPLVGWEIAEVGAMPLPGVKDVKSASPHSAEYRGDRLGRRAGQ